MPTNFENILVKTLEVEGWRQTCADKVLSFLNATINLMMRIEPSHKVLSEAA
jgi:hypothetical protein